MTVETNIGIILMWVAISFITGATLGNLFPIRQLDNIRNNIYKSFFGENIYDKYLTEQKNNRRKIK